MSIRRGLAYVEKVFDVAFGSDANPMYNLGSLAFLFFWIVAATGIYLFLFFETGTTAAFRSVEYLTHEQWYAGGVARSLHRYAAGAMVLTMGLHLLREFALDRFRGFRWFSWLTGVPVIWLVFFSGINGHWLRWDRLSQYIAVTTTEWLDWLGVFGQPIARNFLDQSTLSDRFFTLLMFLHIGVPLFLLGLLWLHISRISRPRALPPRTLTFGTLGALIALALLKPVFSQGPADLNTVDTTVALDGFFMFVYPLFDRIGYGGAWALVVGLTLFVGALPWLVPHRRAPAAVVDPPNCNGCSRCFADCPYAAVIMQPHPDKPGHELAVVDPSLCASCGICAGACPSSTPFRSSAELITGIDMPQLSVHVLRARLDEALARLRGRARVVVFGCDHAASLREVEGPSVAVVPLLCAGQLPPSFVDYALSEQRADGVLVTGCPGADCHYRLGSRWVEQRFAREREPHLRTRAARERVRVHWAGVADSRKLHRELEAYREELQTLTPARPRAEGSGGADD